MLSWHLHQINSGFIKITLSLHSFCGGMLMYLWYCTRSYPISNECNLARITLCLFASLFSGLLYRKRDPNAFSAEQYIVLVDRTLTQNKFDSSYLPLRDRESYHRTIAHTKEWFFVNRLHSLYLSSQLGWLDRLVVYHRESSLLILVKYASVFLRESVLTSTRYRLTIHPLHS